MPIAMTLPDASKAIQIAGPAGILECLFDKAPVPSDKVAVVCHPHPQYGGTMHNKVVYTLARLLNSRGYDVIRFNYRGVGRSEGEYDNAVGEVADALAVTTWLSRVAPNRSLACAGFSFGAYIAAAVAHQLPLQLLITVAPAVTNCDFSNLTAPNCSWLIVMDEDDDIVEPAAVFDWVANLTVSHQLIKTSGAGHFFHGRLSELRQLIEAGLDASAN